MEIKGTEIIKNNLVDEKENNTKIFSKIKNLETIQLFLKNKNEPIEMNLEEIDDLISQLSLMKDWCYRWKDTISFWDKIINDNDIQILENDLIEIDPKREEEYKKFSFYISFYDFISYDDEEFYNKLIKQIRNEVLKNDDDVVLTINYDVLIISSNEKNKIKKVLGWLYEKVVKPAIDALIE